MRRYGLGALLGALALLGAVACDDGGDDGAPAAPPPQGFFLTPQPDAPVVTPSSSLVEATIPAGITSEFVSLLNGSVATTYRVVYTTKSPDGIAGDRYVVYSKPPLARIDVIEQGAVRPLSSLFAREPEGSVQCSREGDDWTCVEISMLGDPLVVTAGPIVFPGVSDVQEGAIQELFGRDIAGEPARCFQLIPDDQSGVLDYCLGPGGVPLYASSSLVTAEATEYTATVTDEDFLLPE